MAKRAAGPECAVRLTARAIALAATPVVSEVPAYVALWGLALVVIAVDLLD